MANSPAGGASSTDILTAIQNIVTAINAQTQNSLMTAGAQDFLAVSSGTLIKSGGGRIVNLSIVTAGSSTGFVYDSLSQVSGRAIYIINNAVGIQQVNLPFQYGLFVLPGTGMDVAGSFS